MNHKFFRHCQVKCIVWRAFWDDVGIKTEYSRFIEGIL